MLRRSPGEPPGRLPEGSFSGEISVGKSPGEIRGRVNYREEITWGKSPGKITGGKSLGEISRGRSSRVDHWGNSPASVNSSAELDRSIALVGYVLRVFVMMIFHCAHVSARVCPRASVGALSPYAHRYGAKMFHNKARINN